MLTGPGIYGTAFIISKGETKLTSLGYWPFDYIDKQKNIIWFNYTDEHYYEDDDDKFLKLSVNDFLAAMTTAKIYSAPNAFVSVFWWDEETQIMTLSINNMFFEIDPAIGNINHPRVFWNECYYRYGGEGLDTQSKTLNYNYYPEKS